MTTTAAAWVWGTLLCALMALGCGDPPRGTGRMGSACTDARACRHGYCVAGAGSNDAVCTRSCAATTDCPRGWACSGVTGDNVLVCVQGSPTPFGIGARE